MDRCTMCRVFGELNIKMKIVKSVNLMELQLKFQQAFCIYPKKILYLCKISNDL